VTGQQPTGNAICFPNNPCRPVNLAVLQPHRGTATAWGCPAAQAQPFGGRKSVRNHTVSHKVQAEHWVSVGLGAAPLWLGANQEWGDPSDTTHGCGHQEKQQGTPSVSRLPNTEESVPKGKLCHLLFFQVTSDNCKHNDFCPKFPQAFLVRPVLLPQSW